MDQRLRRQLFRLAWEHADVTTLRSRFEDFISDVLDLQPESQPYSADVRDALTELDIAEPLVREFMRRYEFAFPDNSVPYSTRGIY